MRIKSSNKVKNLVVLFSLSLISLSVYPESFLLPDVDTSQVKAVEDTNVVKVVEAEMLQKAAADVAKIELNVQVEDLKVLESPLALVKACRVQGGPAPDEVEKALVEWEKKLLLVKSDVIKLDKELEEAKNELEKAVKAQFSMNFYENVNLKNSNL